MINFLIRKRKTLILLSVLLVGFIVLYFIYFTFLRDKEFFMPFRRSISLNYRKDNVSFVEIYWHINDDMLISKIEDIEKIKRIIDYVNSIEIVEVRNVPINKFRIIKYSESYDYISLNFGGNKIEFMTDYMWIIYHSHDMERKNYYIKNSGYDNETKSSNIHQFLRDLIND